MDAADAAPVPEPLVALTVKVYDVPFVRPVMVHVRGLVPHDFVSPPGLEVMV